MGLNVSNCNLDFFSCLTDLPTADELCARELRQVGDKLYWRYKLLEMLLKNYEAVNQIK